MTPLQHPIHKHTRQIEQWDRQDTFWGILKALPIVLIVVLVVALLAGKAINHAAYEAVEYQPCYLRGC